MKLCVRELPLASVLRRAVPPRYSIVPRSRTSSGNFIRHRNCPIRVRLIPTFRDSSVWLPAASRTSKSSSHSAIWRGLKRKLFGCNRLSSTVRLWRKLYTARHTGCHFLDPSLAGISGFFRLPACVFLVQNVPLLCHFCDRVPLFGPRFEPVSTRREEKGLIREKPTRSRQPRPPLQRTTNSQPSGKKTVHPE